jgi:hypothetical protein
MRVATGKVLKSGMVQVEGKPLAVGTRVAIVVAEGWTVDAATKKKLLRAMEQSKRGEVFDADEVLGELRRMK